MDLLLKGVEMIPLYLILLVFFFGYGALLRYRAPKEIGHILGFRFGRSTKSQANWDQGNYQFGGWLLQAGIVAAIVILLIEVGPFKGVSWDTGWLLIIPIAIMVLAVFHTNLELPD